MILQQNTVFYINWCSFVSVCFVLNIWILLPSEQLLRDSRLCVGEGKIQLTSQIPAEELAELEDLEKYVSHQSWVFPPVQS